MNTEIDEPDDPILKVIAELDEQIKHFKESTEDNNVSKRTDNLNIKEHWYDRFFNIFNR